MTNIEIRNEFDNIAAKLRHIGNYSSAAHAELFREWFTDPKFRKNLFAFYFRKIEQDNEQRH